MAIGSTIGNVVGGVTGTVTGLSRLANGVSDILSGNYAALAARPVGERDADSVLARPAIRGR